MQNFGGAATMAVTAFLLAGCGSGGASSSTTTVTETVTETAQSGSSATSEGSSAPDKVEFGQPIEGNIVEFTVSDVRDVTNSADAVDSGTWAAMIEICATGDLGGPISPMTFFTLLGDDGSTYQPNGSSGGMMPTPQLDPGSVSVAEGECRKGNLFFSAPSDAKIAGVEVVDDSGVSMGTWGS